MQGTSTKGRSSGRRYLALLVTAHLATAATLLAIVAELGRALVSPIAPAMSIGAVAAVATLGAFIDLRAISRRSFSLGPPRQTAKALAHAGLEWWTVPLLWGMDTGLIWTTYRVSFCSWLLLLFAVLGMAPVWIGIAYGLAFGIPLVAIIAVPDRRNGEACDVVPRRWMPPQWAQAAGVATMALVAVYALRSLAG